jgi:cellulose synthase/poly-beta-1,6-N-acetylglucosamine synthase-like glycosyltransferase
MLAATLVESLALFIACWAVVLLGGRGARREAPRPAVAVIVALVGATAISIGSLLGIPGRNSAAAGLAFVAFGLAWLPTTRNWSLRGHLAWTSTTLFTVAYLGYMLVWTLQSQLGVIGTCGGLVLWLLELAAFTFGLVSGRELLDVLTRRKWERRHLDDPCAAPTAFPFVSLHVPAYNEPPEMVLATLESLLRIDYPAFEIVMIDDNTTDTALWRPVENFCASRDISFHHLEDWPGYKSGALNYALAVTDPRAEVVGIVDADYLVEPDYLRRCAPLFAQRPRLGFVQTPQDYREWRDSAYYRRLYYSYDYFFRVSQVSRNERNGAIFGGTMGLIRREALEQLGGWDEWCITEDAELSLRLLKAGWDGQHIETSFGRGVMPLSFEALKRQRYRWCFGGVQILRKHWRSLMPWDRSTDNGLSQRQRYDYLTGGLQWFGDLIGLGFALLLLAGALSIAVGNGLTFRRLSGALLVVPPLLIGFGLARTVAIIRDRTGATLRDAAGALRMWLALGLTVAKACATGLVRSEGVFMRTPKLKGEGSWHDAVRANPSEVAFGSALAACIPLVLWQGHGPVSVMVALLLAWHATALLLAPAQTFAALHADLPSSLRRLRRNEWVRDRLSATRRPLGVGLAVACIAGAALLAAVVLAPPHRAGPGPTANVLDQARGGATHGQQAGAAGGTTDATRARSSTTSDARRSGRTSTTARAVGQLQPGRPPGSGSTPHTTQGGALGSPSTSRPPTSTPATATTAPAPTTVTAAPHPTGPPTTATRTTGPPSTRRATGPPSPPTTRAHP